jgi:hypothetical protein
MCISTKQLFCNTKLFRITYHLQCILRMKDYVRQVVSTSYHAHFHLAATNKPFQNRPVPVGHPVLPGYFNTYFSHCWSYWSSLSFCSAIFPNFPNISDDNTILKFSVNTLTFVNWVMAYSFALLLGQKLPTQRKEFSFWLISMGVKLHSDDTSEDPSVIYHTTDHLIIFTVHQIFIANNYGESA